MTGPRPETPAERRRRLRDAIVGDAYGVQFKQPGPLPGPGDQYVERPKVVWFHRPESSPGPEAVPLERIDPKKRLRLWRS